MLQGVRALHYSAPPNPYRYPQNRAPRPPPTDRFQDGKMTLRLFGKSDEILRLLLPELGFGLSIVKPPVWPKVGKMLGVQNGVKT